MAVDMGMNIGVVNLWLRGTHTPTTRSCRRLAEYSGVPLQDVLDTAHHTPMVAESATDTWPDFREYASKKYGAELDDDIITVIEDLIERRRDRKSGRDKD
jgi:hypothetical protein